MFVPEQYREPDGSWMVELVRRNPLALLTTNGPDAGVPYATHLPVIPDPQAVLGSDLRGARLLGHMNRANPHWASLEAEQQALLVFTGPHSYVSPTIYQVTPAAPTWNFTAVHLCGTLRKLESADESLGVVRATVRTFETTFATGWDMSASIDYFRRILPGVGAFCFEVSRADGMFKLSQEQKPEIRERVRRSFARAECGPRRAVAELMSRLAKAETE